MNKNLTKLLNNVTILTVIFTLLFQIILLNEIYAQTLSITGKVTSARFPIQNASITFIDNSDTTKKVSALTDASGNYSIDLLTSIENNKNNLPAKFELGQSYPNPFSTSTVIPYEINTESNIQVTIYDILGRVVRKFEAGQQSIGFHNVLWDGLNNFGLRVAAGIYFYKLQAGGESQVKKMIFDSGSKNLSSLPQINFPRKLNTRFETNNLLQDVSYTVRIENTSSTIPAIVSEEIENIEVKNDTTINFSVTYIPVAIVDFDSLHQHISGFGAANILPWRPDMTDSEIEAAFGTGEGQLGFTILRLRLSPNPNDWGNNVSTAKKAYDMGATIIAAPWSPPASMKTNNNLVGGELKEDAYDDFAAHLNSFVDFMSDNDVPIFGVSVQNEPDIEVSYESCDYSPAQMLKFMQENASSIETKVMAPESFQFRRNMSDPLLNDSAASANLDIVAGHIYGGGLATYPLAEQKGKELWMTEHLTGENSHSNDWSWAFQVAEEMNGVMKAGMSAYIWWYIVRFYGPISDGERENEGGGQKGEVTKKGYVMSQFARFIRPGYYRTETKVYPPIGSTDVTAYKDPSSSKVVIVATNSGSAQVEKIFRLQNGMNATTFTPYTTSESKNCEQGNEFTVTDGNFTFTLEPSSITTFVSN